MQRTENEIPPLLWTYTKDRITEMAVTLENSWKTIEVRRKLLEGKNFKEGIRNNRQLFDKRLGNLKNEKTPRLSNTGFTDISYYNFM